MDRIQLKACKAAKVYLKMKARKRRIRRDLIIGFILLVISITLIFV